MTTPSFRWSKLLIKLAIWLIAIFVFGPIILGFLVSLIISLIVVRFAFSLLPGRRSGGGGGFLRSVAIQVVSFFLTSRIVRPKDTVPVQDVRLRDAFGNEHLIRIEGYLRSGNLNIGDDVIVEGYNNHGTLMVSQGYNKRTRSQIKVKRP